MQVGGVRQGFGWHGAPGDTEAVTLRLKSEIWLRLAGLAQVQGALHRYVVSLSVETGQQHVAVSYGISVLVAGRWHDDKLSFDQLHSIFRAEEAAFV